ncbi:MAG TPA: alpha/beta hydrolase-fold protein [Rugosimonospora sp.]|nr:alpha/beta hydrolase-fold protein [Rugosimonospora sp.]
MPIIASASLLVVLAGLAITAGTGALDKVPLLDGAASAIAEVTGAALLVGAWWRRDRRWLSRGLPLLLFGVAALVGVIAFLLWVTGTVTDAYPPSFAIWVGAAFAAVFGLPLVLWQFTRDRAVALRKTAAVFAVPLTLTGGFMLIDQEYGIWPQVGDVLGHSGALDGQKALHDLTDGATGGGGAPQRGVIVSLDAPSTRSHFPHRAGVVFLPPAYFGAARDELPVLVMLVGAPGTPINWLKAGHGQATDDAYAQAHQGRAPVLVVVDQNGSATGDTECVDGPLGNAETYVAVDVPAFIAGTLHLKADPARWGIVGFSEGGTCALDLVLGHPNVYRHAVDLGGDLRPNLGNPKHTLEALYGGAVAAVAAHDPARLLATHHYPGVTAWFGAGVQDTRGITVGTQLAGETSHAGIPTHRFTGEGGHNWQFASGALATIFPELCGELGCTTKPAPGHSGTFGPKVPVKPPKHVRTPLAAPTARRRTPAVRRRTKAPRRPRT